MYDKLTKESIWNQRKYKELIVEIVNLDTKLKSHENLGIQFDILKNIIIHPWIENNEEGE